MLAVSLVVVVVVVALPCHTHAATDNLYQRRYNSSGDGSLILTKNVSSALSCGVMCMQMNCSGYNLKPFNSTMQECSLLSSVDDVDDEDETSFYCGSCKSVGENCSSDWECADILNATCDVATSTCKCPLGHGPSGASCVIVPVAFGESCDVDAQCLAATKDTKCDLITKTCNCKTSFDVNDTGNGCKINYAAYGFVNYNGRLIFHLFGAIPVTWNWAYTFCDNIYARMFTPRDASEWSWLESKTRGVFLNVAVFFPINDKDTEGDLRWNDGSPAGTESFLKWQSGAPAATNLDGLDCVMLFVKVFILVPQEFIAFTDCNFNLAIASIICEADPP